MKGKGSSHNKKPSQVVKLNDYKYVINEIDSKTSLFYLQIKKLIESEVKRRVIMKNQKFGNDGRSLEKILDDLVDFMGKEVMEFFSVEGHALEEHVLDNQSTIFDREFFKDTETKFSFTRPKRCVVIQEDFVSDMFGHSSGIIFVEVPESVLGVDDVGNFNVFVKIFVYLAFMTKEISRFFHLIGVECEYSFSRLIGVDFLYKAEIHVKSPHSDESQKLILISTVGKELCGREDLNGENSTSFQRDDNRCDLMRLQKAYARRLNQTSAYGDYENWHLSSHIGQNSIYYNMLVIFMSDLLESCVKARDSFIRYAKTLGEYNKNDMLVNKSSVRESLFLASKWIVNRSCLFCPHDKFGLFLWVQLLSFIADEEARSGHCIEKSPTAWVKNVLVLVSSITDEDISYVRDYHYQRMSKSNPSLFVKILSDMGMLGLFCYSEFYLLREEAQKSIYLLDHGLDQTTIEGLFYNVYNVLVVFDSIVEIKNIRLIKREGLKGYPFSSWAIGLYDPSLKLYVQRLIDTGLGSRIKISHPYYYEDGVTHSLRIGLIYDESNIIRLVDRGPDYEEHSKDIKLLDSVGIGLTFKDFWGPDKTEIRKFRDHSLKECVVWDNHMKEVESRYEIARFIIIHVLKRHIESKQVDVEKKSGNECWKTSGNVIMGGLQYYSLVEKKEYDNQEMYILFFEQLSHIFKNIKSPLSIKEILPLSSSFRRTNSLSNSYNTCPNPLEMLKSMETNKKVNQDMVYVHDILLRFEDSHSWPDIQHGSKYVLAIVIEWLVFYSKRLKESDKGILTSLRSFAHSVAYLDIMFKGFVYRLWIDTCNIIGENRYSVIYNEKDIVKSFERLKKVQCDFVILSWNEKQSLSRYIEEYNICVQSEGENHKKTTIFWSFEGILAHSSLLRNIVLRCPISFCGTVRLVDLWMSLNYLTNDMSIESMELIVVFSFFYYYQNCKDLLSETSRTAASALLGFCRVLYMFPRIDFRSSPLVLSDIDLRRQIQEDDANTSIHSVKDRNTTCRSIVERFYKENLDSDNGENVIRFYLTYNETLEKFHSMTCNIKGADMKRLVSTAYRHFNIMETNIFSSGEELLSIFRTNSGLFDFHCDVDVGEVMERFREHNVFHKKITSSNVQQDQDVLGWVSMSGFDPLSNLCLFINKRINGASLTENLAFDFNRNILTIYSHKCFPASLFPIQKIFFSINGKIKEKDEKNDAIFMRAQEMVEFYKSHGMEVYEPFDDISNIQKSIESIVRTVSADLIK